MQKFLEKINAEESQKKQFSLGFYEVNLKNILENIQKIRAHAEEFSEKKLKYLLPVKGNGYGCGMRQVAQFCETANACDYLGVAHVQEAFEIRKEGIKMPILILGQTSAEEKFLDFLSTEKVEVAVSDFVFIDAINTQKKKVSVHLKIDLGMGRCGIFPENSLALFQKILDSDFAQLTGVMMHFPVSDSENPEDIAFTNAQIQKFLDLKKEMQKLWEAQNLNNFSEIIFHAANSGGAIEHAEALKECGMLRVGIASYGYPEPGKMAEILELKPVVQVYSYFTLLKNFPENSSIGYGRTYFTPREERIAILPLGYADGLNRRLSNSYSVFAESGEKFLSVGRVSMDQSAYRIDSEISEKDLLSQKIFVLGAEQNAKEIASILGTISYEVIISMGSSDRLQKIWVY